MQVQIREYFNKNDQNILSTGLVNISSECWTTHLDTLDDDQLIFRGIVDHQNPDANVTLEAAIANIHEIQRIEHERSQRVEAEIAALQSRLIPITNNIASLQTCLQATRNEFALVLINIFFLI
ncbi:unnamed protein product [Rotaria magnacalcarata]|uniref:Uncharacterized protein n=1 Tax=Rotaria magnacalcarata TaxID=392030 RepID=A0A8S2MXG6_9BILA|nr:unnamed protein product [Rotaria magnacalcarata]CAF3909639.1 unnamed protein product [Rotaria magnacalcarata]CAF3966556.1 unnamed protein product [Rotaria magnacalcarata]